MRQTILSDCRSYRYVLWREWGDGLLRNDTYVVFIGLNPSTADESKDDPTIRKCVGFAKRWGYGALCMVNLFAYRATEPRVMKGHGRPVGDDNDRWLAAMSRDVNARLIVAAWGNHGAFMGRDEEVLKLLDNVHCLRTTKEGQPEHPLYIPYDTQPRLYNHVH